MNRPGQLRALALALLPTLAAGAGQPVEPRDLQVQGEFTHPAAGFILPETAGEFRRVDVTQYDEAATNISAGYRRAALGGAVWPIEATVYVYPARGQQDVELRFTSLLHDIGRYHGGAQPTHTESVTLASGRFAGRVAVFEYEEPFYGVRLPLRSYFVLYRWKDWWVKWRVTTPAPRDGEPMRAMHQLIEAVVPPWDGHL